MDLTTPEPANQTAKPAQPIPWAWLLGLTAAALAIRLVYLLAVHRVGDFLYSDMLETYRNAEALADPDHVLDAWDVVKPRGLPTVGGVLLTLFPAHAKLLWGLLQVLLSTATVPLALAWRAPLPR